MTTSKEESAKAQSLFAIIDEMLRVNSCFETLFAEMQSASGLSTLQKLVLHAVLVAPESMTVPQVGRDTGHPRQVVQRIVNELVEQGLIIRAENPRHRRAALLVPTEKAIAMRDQAERRAIATARDVLGDYSLDQCKALADDLGTLRRVMEESLKTLVSEADVTPSPVSVSRALATL